MAARDGGVAVPAAADGTGASAGVCYVHGAHPAVAVAHGAAQRPRAAASRVLRGRYVDVPTSAARDWRGGESLERLLGGPGRAAGRPSCAPWPP